MTNLTKQTLNLYNIHHKGCLSMGQHIFAPGNCIPFDISAGIFVAKRRAEKKTNWAVKLP